jgi:excisionase family DNA binding protein
LEELMTAAQAAHRLGTPRTHVHEMVAGGRLTGIKVPTRGADRPYRLRLLRSEVERLARDGWRQRRPRRTIERSAPGGTE